MNGKIALLALGAILALQGGARAAPPGQARTTGKVLVLDNGRTLDGDIERHGEQYRIRRDMGEVWVPASADMKLCGDWQEAYEFMASRANLLDPDERLRLARWCHLHDLRAQALAEATAAAKMRPEHADSRQLVTVLERALAPAPKMDLVVAPSVPPAPPPPSNDISSDCVALFITRVQPILMNTCVSCHSNGKGGDFQLYRSYHGGTQAATQKNLTAVVNQLDPEHPILSPFLIKAICAHGHASQPPIKRQSVPYKSMQEWVDYVIRQNPHLKKDEANQPRVAKTTPEPRTVSSFSLPPPSTSGLPHLEARQVPRDPVDQDGAATPEPRALPRFSSTTEPVNALPRVPTAPMAAKEASPIVLTGGQAPATTKETRPTASAGPQRAPQALPEPPAPPGGSAFSAGQPPRPVEPADEFDPAIFNRQAHPRQ